MEFIHKGGVWWFLLLAMVLLAPATVGAEQEDGATTITTLQVEEEVGSRADDHGNDDCDIKCAYYQDLARRQFCVDQCHSQQHHHPSREDCELKCQHWQDPTRKELCVQQCMSFGLNLHVGGSSSVHERPHALEEERMSFGLNLHVSGSSSVDEHLRGWEAVAGAIIEEVV
uniref:Plant antimicrobial peptide domain-containing protein n=1 Tax=Aegilops tauschii TaxID=37682 RepID=N1R4N0_AEGTA